MHIVPYTNSILPNLSRASPKDNPFSDEEIHSPISHEREVIPRAYFSPGFQNPLEIPAWRNFYGNVYWGKRKPMRGGTNGCLSPGGIESVHEYPHDFGVELGLRLLG